MKQVKKVYRGKPAPFATVMRTTTGLEPDEIDLLIAMGGAYAGKYRCKDPARVIKDGQEVSAWFRLPLVMEPVAFDPAWILRREQGLLITNKPAGLPTQGRRDADYMAFYELVKQEMGGYVGLHHRLDQGTSGLLLFTVDKAANQPLADLFQQRKIQKTYLAVAVGPWDGADTKEIDAPIGPVRGQGVTTHAVTSAGKSAQTAIRLLASHGDRHLLEVKPLTGRTHQIRVHLKHLGLPLFGDALYGGEPGDQFYLHCARLCWPKQGKLKAHDVTAPPPQNWRDAFPELMACYDEAHREEPC